MSADVSKASGYVVVATNRSETSKQTTYVAVKPSEQVRVSSQSAYSVLRFRPAQPDVSKQSAYAVMYFNPGSQNRFVSKQVGYAVLYRDWVFHPLSAAEVIAGGYPTVRHPLDTIEVITGGYPVARLPLMAIDVITGGYPEVRLPIIALEVLFGPKEEPVPVEPSFPAAPGGTPIGPQTGIANPRRRLRGMGWSVHKKPTFNTKISPHVSGHEVRAAFYQFPRYEFNVIFEYLKDDIAAPESDLKLMMGMFLQMNGSYGEFTFEDPTDFYIEDQAIATGDGGTLQFNLVREYGGFTEPVGQINFDVVGVFTEMGVSPADNTIDITSTEGMETGYGPLALTTTGTLPDGLSLVKNYWAIVVSSSKIKLALSKADAEAGTAVDIIDDGTGGGNVINSAAIYVNEVLQDLDQYTITQNQLVFDVAPGDTDPITGTYHYFYVCRFLDDIQDYENFAYQLWTLQECNFISVLPEEIVA